ncbi:TolC family protein [Aestuariicella sp. G3-2]|jgi:outer membrane protein TolC|uniref:TolC family protein n=1 Tax=Pseudomaricurvus albidus TaxID=2842452 RepID=UPI001C0CEB0B|nr:TolC family protein [Aestuariicella albida]MBU3069214.1 TolC family protein [Aestuariicella albida]
MRFDRELWRPLLCVSVIAFSASFAHAESYTLERAVKVAQQQDPWLLGSVKRQESLEALSIESGSLPDPSVSLGVANLPVDTFDFSQEGMTQFKVGVSQMFPRGKTLSLKREKLQKLSEMQPYARADRNANVAVTVAQLWLDAYRSEQTIQLIERDRGLFEHLVDVAQSSYTTAAGKTRQQDLVRAQLELTRLDDRLARLRQQRDMSLARLGEWLGNPSISLSNISSLEGRISLSAPDLIETPDLAVKLRLLTESLNRHPKVKRIDSKIKAFDSGVRLAKQSYKPQWGVNASYGYRDQTPMGDDRSDFFSVGVSFDVPLFTGKRQDKKVQSANAELEAVKTERVLVLRQLKSGYDTAEATYLRLVERKSLFDTRLLREMAEQAEASLSAYTNDDGDFAEVVRARIAELNARIEALHVEIDMQKNIAQLNYFHAGTQPNKESKSVAF